MALRQPTREDKQQAREYLLKRMDAVNSMSYNLEKLFHEAIKRIVIICYQFNLKPKELNTDEIPEKVLIRINEVIEWLYETVTEYFDTLVNAAPDSDSDYLLPWVKRERAGMTFEQRLSKYCDQFRLEMLILTAAGVAVGLGSAALITSIFHNLKKPWDNPDLKEEIKNVPSYGIGRTNSMYTAVNALTRDGVASGWMKAKYINDKKKNCIGWWVERGSSIPCDICDPQTGFHYNDSQLPLYHLSCCCTATPVYNK